MRHARTVAALTVCLVLYLAFFFATSYPSGDGRIVLRVKGERVLINSTPPHFVRESYLRPPRESTVAFLNALVVLRERDAALHSLLTQPSTRELLVRLRDALVRTEAIFARLEASVTPEQWRALESASPPGVPEHLLPYLAADLAHAIARMSTPGHSESTPPSAADGGGADPQIVGQLFRLLVTPDGRPSDRQARAWITQLNRLTESSAEINRLMRALLDAMTPAQRQVLHEYVATDPVPRLQSAPALVTVLLQ